MDVSVGRESSGGSNKGGGGATTLAGGATALKERLTPARAVVSADDLRRKSRRECGCNQVRGAGVTVVTMSLDWAKGKYRVPPSPGSSGGRPARYVFSPRRGLPLPVRNERGEG